MSAGLCKIAWRDFGKVRYGDFGLGDVRMPELFPFEAVIAFVVCSRQSLYLARNRNVAFAGEDVASIFVLGNRVFQVGVANPLAEFADREFWLFMAIHKGVMGVPKEQRVGVVGFAENLL